MRTSKGVITGYLKIVDRVSQGSASADDLLSTATAIYLFQQTDPLTVLTEVGDSVTVIKSQSGMVNPSDVLKVVSIAASPIPIVNKLLGVKLTLVTNTVRYRS